MHNQASAHAHAGDSEVGSGEERGLIRSSSLASLHGRKTGNGTGFSSALQFLDGLPSPPCAGFDSCISFFPIRVGPSGDTPRQRLRSEKYDSLQFQHAILTGQGILGADHRAICGPHPFALACAAAAAAVCEEDGGPSRWRHTYLDELLHSGIGGYAGIA